VLESAPRLTQWSPELWRETTVFSGQFRLFAAVGAPLDLAAIACPAVLAFMVRGHRVAVRFALAAVALYAASLGAWFAIVKPANDILATWTQGPMADNFAAIRWQWESGHMVVAAVKLLGFAMLMLSLLSIRRVSDSR